MKKIKAVMFDYDGTLMDTNSIIIESWQHTFRTVVGREHPEEELYGTFGEILHDTMKRFFPHEDVERCVEIYRSYQVGRYQKMIQMFPGMENLVRELHSQGILTAVVTSRLLPTTMQGLEKYGMDDAFDAVVTCKDTEAHKPDPAPVLFCAEKLDIEPGEALMVGDTAYDIICGNRAGARTALVSWSAACVGKQLEGEAKPDFTAKTAADILAFVAERR